MSAGGDARSGLTSSQTLGSTSLFSAGSYWDLPKDVLALDAVLYNVLKMCVNGFKRILLDCVSFPSYIQGICVLYRHADISCTYRITQAFEGMDKLSYDGDVTTWLSSTLGTVRELFYSGAGIRHYALMKVLKSFDGKVKTIQYRMAQDINSRIIDENTNIFDMIQSYATGIATDGDSSRGNSRGVTVVEQGDRSFENGAVSAVSTGDNEVCSHCKKPGHKESSCFDEHPHLLAELRAKRSAERAKFKAKKAASRPGTGDSAPATPVVATPAANVTASADNVDVRAGLAELFHCLQASPQQHVATGLTPDYLKGLRERSDTTNFAPPATRSAARAEGGGLGHRGERIGEASHPGPSPSRHWVSPMFSNTSTGSPLVCLLAAMVTVFSVCDGVGCAAMWLQNCNATVNRYAQLPTAIVNQLSLISCS